MERDDLKQLMKETVKLATNEHEKNVSKSIEGVRIQLAEMTGTLNTIKDETKKTNGRVTTLELNTNKNNNDINLLKDHVANHRTILYSTIGVILLGVLGAVGTNLI